MLQKEFLKVTRSTGPCAEEARQSEAVGECLTCAVVHLLLSVPHAGGRTAQTFT